jgi:uncharacterized membrane-anchored protein YhcB (DUF1043 family)
MLAGLIHRFGPITIALLIAISLGYVIRRQSWRRILPNFARACRRLVRRTKRNVPLKLFYCFISVVIGLLIGIFFHYLVYRFTLPTKPFVYAAF